MVRRRASIVLALALTASSERVADASITKGPWVQHVTPTSAVIRVEVDPPSPVTVEIDGPMSLDGATTRKVASGAQQALHSIAIDELQPQKRYTYTVRTSGESRPAAFTTAPKDPVSFKFLVYGDNRSDDAAHAAIVRQMVTVPTDFLVNTGDFVENGASKEEWQSFFEIEAPLLRERCLIACVGNHEITDGQGMSFIRYFGPSELAPPAEGPMLSRPQIAPEQLQGTFRWGSARFFLVNGMVGYRTGPDRTWLEKALSDSDNEPGLTWRVVVTHHAPWSSGPHGDNLLFTQAHLVDVFRAHKIDLFLGGHDHIYERGAVDGMPYLISGGGGAPLYRIKNPKPFAKKLESAHHFIAVSVTDAAMQIVATRADGSTIERCDLRKGAGWDCDGTNKPPALTSAVPSGSGASTSTTSSSGAAPSAPASKCACRAAGSRGPGTLAALAGSLCGVTLVARRRRRGNS
jgi:hypothetical protein